MHWYLDSLRHYANFNGRASKAAFWYFHCGNLLLLFCLFSLSVFCSVAIGFTYYHLIGIYAMLFFCVAMLVPSVAVTVRRLHDTGRSGWWALILLLPFVGIAILLNFLLEDGQVDANEYGLPSEAATTVLSDVLDDGIFIS
ncbi:MAG: DUF805 domain-containing protein [Bacteroidota bacterium]